jgi:glycosyltransferase involved in cell wall biosynthesis
MASRLSSEKDFMTAVRAVRESVMHYKKTGLIIVGDGPEKETILRRAREAGIEGHVFIEPWAGRETLLSYYKTAHLFLSTSLYEGYGMSMVEAVATGLPVVATDAGIASGLLVGTKNVTTVCPVKGVKCLFDKIRWFVEDLEFRRRFPVEVTTRLPDFSYADEADYLSRYKADWERCFVETDTDNVDASLKNEDKK